MPETPMASPKNKEDANRPASPVEPVAGPTLSLRMLRVLPRTFLLLVLLSIVWLFREVLLPFALAVFLGYLLFPLVSRIENGRLRRWQWRMPRWTAVIIVYAILITVGWHTLPGIGVSLWREIYQLKGAPETLNRLVDDQERFLDWVEERFEVKQLETDTSVQSIRMDLERLQTGSLSTSPLLPSPLEQEGGEQTGIPSVPSAQGSGAQFSMVSVHLHFDGWSPPKLTAPSGTMQPVEVPEGQEAGSAPLPESPIVQPELQEHEQADPGEALPEDPGTPVDSEDADTAPSQERQPAAIDSGEPASPEQEGPPKRFSDEAREEAHAQLIQYVNQILAEPGPAPEQLPDMVRQQIDRLNATHLGLPTGDVALERFKQITADLVATEISQEEWPDRLRAALDNSKNAIGRWATQQIGNLTSLATALVTGVFDFFLILMLTAFFLVFFTRIRDYVRDLIPPAYREDYSAVLKRIDLRLSGAIRGQVVICIVNGFLTYPGVLAIGYTFEVISLMQFALLLSVVAAILSLIPIFGVILSTVPMVLFALTGSPWAALAVVGWICVIHAIEAYILNPYILGQSAQINPIIVVFALLAGKQTAGLVGALLAVPIASVVVAMFGYYRRRMARVYAAEAGVDASEDKWGD